VLQAAAVSSASLPYSTPPPAERPPPVPQIQRPLRQRQTRHLTVATDGYWALRPDAIDCTVFRDPGARSCRRHCGYMPIIMGQLAQNRNMTAVLAGVLRSLRAWHPEVLLVCRSGRHRSVGVAALLQQTGTLSGFFRTLGFEAQIEWAHRQRLNWPCVGPPLCYHCTGRASDEAVEAFEAAWRAALVL
jgi:hypothetical protein